MLYVVHKDNQLFRALGGQLAYTSYNLAYKEIKNYAKMYAQLEYEKETSDNWYDLNESIKLAIYEETLASFEVVSYVPVD